MTHYDGRGYGYFSLIKPMTPPQEPLCPFCGLPIMLCECDDDNLYDDDNEGYDYAD